MPCRYSMLARNKLIPIISNTTSFKTLKRATLKEVKNFETPNSISIQARLQTFVKNIKTLMTSNNIREYKFNIIDNKLESITISKLPFIGDMKVPIYEKKKQNIKNQESTLN